MQAFAQQAVDNAAAADTDTARQLQPKIPAKPQAVDAKQEAAATEYGAIRGTGSAGNGVIITETGYGRRCA
jgi:hypothetical protein